MEDKQYEKPFIHLLSSPNSKYVYEVNRNDIVEVSDQLYNALNDILRDRSDTIDDSVKEEYECLKSQGYLSTHRVSEIQHPVTPYLQYYLDRKIQKITLQVTQNCNLRCAYCVYSDMNNGLQRSHSKRRMDFDVAKKAIDFLAEHSIDTDKVNISFYGGEPLLEFPLIKKVVVYAKEVLEGKLLTFNLTSNCTLLNDEIIQYFIQENIQLMVSIDGPESIHDSCRRFAANGEGTFKIVMEKLQYIKEHYPEYMKSIHVSMVINPQNDFECINSVFVDYDVFNAMNVHSSIIDDIYSIEKISYADRYIEDQNYQIFLAYLAEFGRYSIDKVSPISLEEIHQVNDKRALLSTINNLPDRTAPGGPCIPGQLRLFIDVFGNFFPCERVNEKSEIMNIGSIENGFDYDKANTLLNVGKISEKECKNCWAFHSCTLCAKYADDCGKLCKDMKMGQCDSVRDGAENILNNIILMKEVEERYI